MWGLPLLPWRGAGVRGPWRRLPLAAALVVVQKRLLGVVVPQLRHVLVRHAHGLQLLDLLLLEGVELPKLLEGGLLAGARLVAAGGERSSMDVTGAGARTVTACKPSTLTY